MTDEMMARMQAEMQRRAAPLNARYQEAGAHVAVAREKTQEAAELLQRAARAIHGHPGETEVTALSLALLEVAEGETDAPERSFRRLHAFVGEEMQSEMKAIEAAIIEEFGGTTTRQTTAQSLRSIPDGKSGEEPS